MRRRTIRKRIRLACFPKSAEDRLFNLMHGSSDISTEVGNRNNARWILALKSIKVSDIGELYG